MAGGELLGQSIMSICGLPTGAQCLACALFGMSAWENIVFIVHSFKPGMWICTKTELLSGVKIQ